MPVEKRLFITMLLNFLITVLEIAGGVVSGSLSLLSDAIHNFSDGVAVIVSYLALRLGRKPRTLKYTFGLKRAEILAAILNASTLLKSDVLDVEVRLADGKSNFGLSGTGLGYFVFRLFHVSRQWIMCWNK